VSKQTTWASPGFALGQNAYDYGVKACIDLNDKYWFLEPDTLRVWVGCPSTSPCGMFPPGGWEFRGHPTMFSNCVDVGPSFGDTWVVYIDCLNTHLSCEFDIHLALAANSGGGGGGGGGGGSTGMHSDGLSGMMIGVIAGLCGLGLVSIVVGLFLGWYVRRRRRARARLTADTELVTPLRGDTGDASHTTDYTSVP